MRSANPAQRVPTRTRRQIFTLVELLVVVAIISILAALLLPALKSARHQALSIGCKNNLKSFGAAHAMYQLDWNGFLLPYYKSSWWEEAISPYLGMQEYQSPYVKPGSVFTCPVNPDYPSLGYNKSMNQTSGYTTVVNNISAFTNPSGKVFMIDANTGVVHVSNFAVANTIKLRHPGNSANIVFLDGHVNSYGTPPLPFALPHWSVTVKWLSQGYDPPDGL